MAKRSSKQMTANQLAYAKEIRRIKQAVRRAEKRGYRFFEDVVPQTPKRVTKQAVQRAKEIRGERLYDKAQYLDENTGKIVSGTEGRKLEAQERARKSAETRRKKKEKEPQYYPNGGSIIASNIVDDFIARLQEPEPPVFPYTNRMARQMELLMQARQQSKTTLLSITNMVISDIGKSALGWRLEERVDEVNEALDVLLYRASSSEDVMGACSELAEIIKGTPLTMSEKQDIGEQEEYNESFEYPQ